MPSTKMPGDATFQDVAATTGVDDARWGMGAVAADYDNDGDPDLYVTNYGANRFYQNAGNGTFTDHAPLWPASTMPAGVRAPRGATTTTTATSTSTWQTTSTLMSISSPREPTRGCGAA